MGLSTSPGSGGAYALVLNESDGNRRLPIIIGTFEAQAIALELENIRPPRPMTHDLIRNLIQGFNSYVKHIIINELKEGTFYAQIVMDSSSNDKLIDARPSDAIAIAIRFNAPIYVSDTVLDEAGILAEIENANADIEDFDAAVSETLTEKTSNPSQKQTPQEKLAELKKKLEIAISNEDYEKAANIRDQINQLKS